MMNFEVRNRFAQSIYKNDRIPYFYIRYSKFDILRFVFEPSSEVQPQN